MNRHLTFNARRSTNTSRKTKVLFLLHRECREEKLIAYSSRVLVIYGEKIVEIVNANNFHITVTSLINIILQIHFCFIRHGNLGIFLTTMVEIMEIESWLHLLCSLGNSQLYDRVS